ncbi:MULTISPECIES: TetR-like C-terminal domain-containing protein [unclassified Nonomuraea]|uniref:TetR-like C-terminal domain-containing protein n=1 Tax=unclassified Nonomuraea TaxID=2593643 RepID=UPI0033C1C8E8
MPSTASACATRSFTAGQPLGVAAGDDHLGAALRQILDRAAARGEIPPDVDRELLIDVVYGVLWYRLMLNHAPLGEDAGRELTGLLIRAVSA